MTNNLRIGQGPRLKQNIIVLLKELSRKMTANDALLYSKISAVLSHPQRDFLLQQRRTNPETHSQTCRVKDLGTLNLKGYLPQAPFLGYQETLQKRRQKECKSQRL